VSDARLFPYDLGLGLVVRWRVGKLVALVAALPSVRVNISARGIVVVAVLVWCAAIVRRDVGAVTTEMPADMGARHRGNCAEGKNQEGNEFFHFLWLSLAKVGRMGRATTRDV
jgi:hypothetical protein